jgi:hypothetical protein
MVSKMVVQMASWMVEPMVAWMDRMMAVSRAF